MACQHCDYPGGPKTYANQACLPLDGKVRSIDWCIHRIVAALNAGGVWTFASCCGHGKVPGRIDLADGRLLLILPDGSAAGDNPYHVPSVIKEPICDPSRCGNREST